MLEALITLCLAAEPQTCREALVPFTGACETATMPQIDGVTASNLRCVPAKSGYPVTEIANGIFVFSGAIEDANPQNVGAMSNAGFIVGRDSVAVIDTLGSRQAGENLYRAIKAVTDKPISHVILTHMHPDHVYGATVFAEAGARVIGHRNLQRALAERAESYSEAMNRLIGPQGFLGSALPKVEVMPQQIDLGDRILDLQAHDLAHSSSDVTVSDRQTGTLFAGDLVFHRHTPALDGSVTGWQTALTLLSAKQVVPGHGDPVLPWPQGGDDTVRYLNVLTTDTRTAIAAGERIGTAVEHIAQSEKDKWSLFDLFNIRNATAAFAELEWE